MRHIFGRAEELAGVAALLDRGARLVSLVGIGGVGKTTLALACARARPGTVVVADLATCRDTTDVVASLARALRLRVPPHAELDAVLGSLSAASCLVLDDAELARDGLRAPLERILDAHPALTVLVTSRVRLGLSAEHVLDTAPLPVPAPELARASDPAIALLADRIGRLRSDIRPEGAELPRLAAIARAADGIPLALELAAGLCRVMGTDEIARLLSERPLEALQSAVLPRTARAASMRHVLDASAASIPAAALELLELASVVEGRLELSVLRGIWQRDPLEAIVLLREASLLAAERAPDGTTRLSMLSVVRAWARERVEASGRARQLASGHARVFAELARELVEQLERSSAEALWEQLRDVRADLRKALAFCLAERGTLATHQAGWLVLALYEGDRLSARYETIRDDLLRAAMLLVGDSRVPELGHRVWSALAFVEARTGRDASAALRRALDDAERDGSGIAKARVLRMQGTLEAIRADTERAAATFEEAITLLGDDAPASLVAQCRWSHADALRETGRLDEARAAWAAATAATARVEGGARDPRWDASAGMVAMDLGVLDEARARLSAAHERFLARGQLFMAAQALGALAIVELATGHLDRAEAGLREAHELGHRFANQTAIASASLYLGVLHADRGEAERACECLREAERAFAALGSEPYARLASAYAALLTASPTRATSERVLTPSANALADAEALLRAAAQGARVRLPPGRHALDLLLAERVASRHLASDLAHVEVARDGAWLVTAAGARVSLAAKPRLRALLAALAEQSWSRPDEPIAIDALCRTLWPHERRMTPALRARLHTAVRALRRAGLGDALRFESDGYRLAGVALAR